MMKAGKYINLKLNTHCVRRSEAKEEHSKL